MKISRTEFADSYLNQKTLRDLRPGRGYTLYEKALGEHFKYSNVTIKEFNYQKLVVFDYQAEVEMNTYFREDYANYGKTWFFV